MDTAMRDLEQIQEMHPEDGSGRRIGMIAMAALAIASLVFAMGVLVGDASEVRAEEAEDPLAALDRAAGLAARAPVEAPEPADVDPEDLTFHAALMDDVRPEVAASLAAATAELAHLDSLGGGPAVAPTAFPSAYPPAPGLPAAVAAGSTDDVLARSVGHDPMMAAALPAAGSAPSRARSEAGTDGKYTLQVISYRSEHEAQVFAESLRARGHASFVVSADIPGRGMHWRVRVGPFETKREAESYRTTFEADERMNTFVVRRRDDA